MHTYAQAITIDPSGPSNAMLAIIAILAVFGIFALSKLNTTGRWVSILLIIAILVVNISAVREAGIDLRNGLNSWFVENGWWELTGEVTFTLLLLVALTAVIVVNRRKPSTGWIVLIVILILLLCTLSWVATAIIWVTDLLATGLAAVLSISL